MVQCHAKPIMMIHYFISGVIVKCLIYCRLRLFSIYLQHLFQIFKVLISSQFYLASIGRIRGNRSATPDLCRLEAAMPSKAISKTSSGFTVRTGPNFSSEFLFTKLSTCANSLSVNPEYAFVKVTSLSPSFTAKV